MVDGNAPTEAPVPEEDSGKEDSLSATLAVLSDELLRLQAEFDNYKKRTAKEKEAVSLAAEAKMMQRMLPIYEEISIAEKEAQKIPDQAVRKGIALVLSKLRSSFEKDGLQEMKLVGEKFDPFRHEAAMHELSDQPEGTIMNVIKKGYLFRGEVLRHAIVSISSGKKAEENAKKEGEK